MKILCEYTASGPSFVRNGWRRVLEAMGHSFKFWDPSRKSAFDAFSETEPDWFIGTTYGVDRAVAKNILKRPEMRVSLFASAWGDYVKDIDTKKYPIVIVNEQEKRAIAELKDACGRPDFVFIHVTDKYLEGTMGGWRSIGVEPIGVLNAYDSILYAGATYRTELACDVFFCGGHWPYKSRNLDRYIVPLCHPSAGLSVKIFGSGSWPVAQYLGYCSDEDNRDSFVSATVSPNVSEPHSTSLNFDIVERVFKSMGCGGFCISDYVDEARELFSPEELIMASDPEDFRALIDHFVAHPEQRLPYIDEGRKKVRESHSYFHRVAKMFRGLGMNDESKRCLDIYAGA